MHTLPTRGVRRQNIDCSMEFALMIWPPMLYAACTIQKSPSIFIPHKEHTTISEKKRRRNGRKPQKPCTTLHSFSPCPKVELWYIDPTTSYSNRFRLKGHGLTFNFYAPTTRQWMQEHCPQKRFICNGIS